ncbi:C6 transcription factor [Arthroderma uncinatum]|uniref:C6 transcription factor n=1 Tax=Arthroderma uncinatum TaxID=74035 RepID=UPI00144A5DBD|nr:C6 transcription factor [Arthroderma uncinatum]KAF3484240.1 C6 transcription factor [Arthroderma uncinatum]
MTSTEALDDSSKNKRKSSAAGLQSAARPVKRRASKACCCCRARKVRCDVVENGSPCTNCRLDDVECVVAESKRKKKHHIDGPSEHSADSSTDQAFIFGSKSDSSNLFPSISDPWASLSPGRYPENEHHVPHLIYQTQRQRIQEDERRRRVSNSTTTPSFVYSVPRNTATPIASTGFGQAQPQSPRPSPRNSLPDYIQPLPCKFQTDDIDYLERKGALTIPGDSLRNELLKSYIQYVHTYMPLLDLDDFLRVIVRNDASRRLSLLLFQAVMFAGTAFIDFKHLKAAGFESRKDARKAFFQKARLLYDFDYEADRISLVQSILLMTHWYEMPDDQKDTWHWMGVSLSLAHTIGLHRDPASSNMDPKRQKLWKRIWWSTYTRDRLIALGMRRPTRIKDEDCDVPLLTVDDFEFAPFSTEVLQVLGDCELTHNVRYQKDLAMMFIEKTKLCLCISHVLSAQYSVLGHKFGGTTETTMMLVPKKATTEACEVRACDIELDSWKTGQPDVTVYRPSTSWSLSRGEEVLHLHRGLLQMIYLATLSALHRPQVLPTNHLPTVEAELQTFSRSKVRHAAVEITKVAQELHSLDLTRYLPTSGVTVLLPAVIIHLLDIKSSDTNIRSSSLARFYQCMQILQRLREIYASADFATSFLEAAIRKAGVHISIEPTEQDKQQKSKTEAPLNTLTPPPDPTPEYFIDPVLSLKSDLGNLEQPVDTNAGIVVSTPPHSASSENGSLQNINKEATVDDILGASTDPTEPSLAEFMTLAHDADITQNDLDALINFEENAATDLFATDDAVDVDLSFPDIGDEFMKGDFNDTNDKKLDDLKAVENADLAMDIEGQTWLNDP